MHLLIFALALSTPSPTTDSHPSSANPAAPEVSLAAVFAEMPASMQDPEKKEPAKDGVDLRVYWKDGFRMEAADKSFSLRISGRFQSDWAWFSADEDVFETGGVGELNDGSELRRAYLGFDGRLFSDWEWKLEWDLAKAGNDFADAYIATPCCVGNLKVGHFKQPAGLEELTSDVHTTFMERSLSSPFKLGRDAGLQLSDTCGGEVATWAFGVFRDTNGNGLSSSSTSDDEYSFTGRTTWTPVYADGGKHLVHVGASASMRNPTTDNVAFTTKPEANLAPTFLTTGNIVDGDEYQLYGLEAAAVFGPLSIQGELMQADVDGTSAGGMDPTLDGYYVYASYFLTGEHRPYKRSTAVFDRVKPNSNFRTKDGGNGSGAWEVGLRYTSLDFSEATVGDMQVDDVTAGVNWYVNPFAKIQFNVIQSSLQRGALDEDATISMVRFQFDI